MPFMLIVSAFPVLMRDPTGHESPLNDDKDAYCSDKYQSNKGGVNCLAFVCLGEDMDHGIANQSPATKWVEQVQEDLEVVVFNASLNGNDEESGKESDQGYSKACQHAETPGLPCG